jgi:hypothetical protein
MAALLSTQRSATTATITTQLLGKSSNGLNTNLATLQSGQEEDFSNELSSSKQQYLSSLSKSIGQTGMSQYAQSNYSKPTPPNLTPYSHLTLNTQIDQVIGTTSTLHLNSSNDRQSHAHSHHQPSTLPHQQQQMYMHKSNQEKNLINTASADQEAREFNTSPNQSGAANSGFISTALTSIAMPNSYLFQQQKQSMMSNDYTSSYKSSEAISRLGDREIHMNGSTYGPGKPIVGVVSSVSTCSSSSSSISSSSKAHTGGLSNNSNHSIGGGLNGHENINEMPPANLYHQRFIKQQQQSLQKQSNTPPSPPVKLSSYSPIKQSQSQQFAQLTSSSSACMSTSALSSIGLSTNNFQVTSNQINHHQQPYSHHSSLSKSNTNLANSYLPNESANNLLYKHFDRNSPSISSPLSLDNISYSSNAINGAGESSAHLYSYATKNFTSSDEETREDGSSTKLGYIYNNSQYKQQQSSFKQKRNDQQGGAKSIQDCVSPLKTGFTLLRPTRQTSKNAVVRFLAISQLSFSIIMHNY